VPTSPRFASASLLVVLATLAYGCKKPTALEPGVEGAVSRAANLELPALLGKAPACPTDLPFVLVSTKRVTIDGDRFPIADVPDDAWLGFTSADKVDGRDDLRITPLSLALAGLAAEAELDASAGRGPQGRTPAEMQAELMATRFPPPKVVLAADRRTPYRVILEAVSTAGRAGGAQLAARAGPRGLGCVVAHAPPTLASPRLDAELKLVAPRSAAPRSLEIAFVLRKDGVDVASSSGAHVAPGCEDVGDGLTIPNRGGALDHAALAACVQQLKESIAQVKDASAVVAVPEATELQTLVRMLEAIAGAELGSGAFDPITLALPPEGSP
jgi:hypothetical protein